MKTIPHRTMVTIGQQHSVRTAIIVQQGESKDLIQLLS